MALTVYRKPDFLYTSCPPGTTVDQLEQDLPVWRREVRGTCCDVLALSPYFIANYEHFTLGIRLFFLYLPPAA